MSTERTQLDIDINSASEKPPNGDSGTALVPNDGYNAEIVSGTSDSDDAASSGSSASASPSSLSALNARDILAQLAVKDIVADSCDSSRVLVTNVDAGTTDEEIRALFGKFGDIREIAAPQDNMKTRVVWFYDIRSAGKVCEQPAGAFILNGNALTVQFATGGEDDDYDGSTLRVYGMPSVVSNGDMFRLFGRFGEVKDIRENEQEDRSRRVFIVEFFDSRHAQTAKECLNNFELLGSRITVDSCRSVPLWQRRRRWQQQMLGNPPQMVRPTHQSHRTATHKASQSWEQMHIHDQPSDTLFTRPGPAQFNVVSSSRGTESNTSTSAGSSAGSGLFSPPMLEPPTDVVYRDHAMQAGGGGQKALIMPQNYPEEATNSAPILPSMNSYDFAFSPLAKQNMTPPSTFGFDNRPPPAFVPVDFHSKNRASSASMSNLMQVPSRGAVEMQPRQQFFSPTSFRSISGSMHSGSGPSTGRYTEFNSASSSPAGIAPTQRRLSGSYSSRPSFQPSSSLAPRRGHQDMRQDYYSIVIIGGRVLDNRTTLMIRNIPNKYTQRMLIEQLDRENPGCYDFLYLPIDFKNNCNVGYAFVNMVNTDYLPAFYASLHNKRWERFNSEKVCEIAYARIQGLEQLLEHFKNSSLLAEDKKVRPVILLNGRYVPFPDPDVVIRVGSSGPHKYLMTDDPQYL